MGLDMSKTSGIGCDGTSTNTGATGGIIRLLEKKLGKPLQWLPCQLHANELLLRHLMKHLMDAQLAHKGSQVLLDQI